jgi:L-threonylcarbamoyladenylate synthase
VSVTRIHRLDQGPESYAAALEAARDALLAGELALLPAEGLYGLHGSAAEAGARARARAIKGSAPERPFILLVGAPDHALALVSGLPGRAGDLMREAWPGPLTLVLPAAASVPADLRPEGRVAVRCPGARLLRDLALSLPAPLVSTSANLAGAPPPRSLSEVDGAVRDACAVAVDAGVLAGEGSTVVRPEPDGALTVLRPGLWKPPSA